jgi:F0F1-type ATP synthase membrane subunit b/b'
MEAATFIELIPTLGFPIVVCIALGWFIWHIYKASEKREEKLMTEITENRVINKQFAEIIGKYEVTLGEIKSDVKDIKDTLHMSQD